MFLLDTIGAYWLDEIAGILVKLFGSRHQRLIGITKCLDWRIWKIYVRKTSILAIVTSIALRKITTILSPEMINLFNKLPFHPNTFLIFHYNNKFNILKWTKAKESISEQSIKSIHLSYQSIITASYYTVLFSNGSNLILNGLSKIW